MLTLLINETKPLAGLFASTTGGIGSVPDISVADDGQAVSVQTFTRTAGVITDSFVAGDVLHIGIGDGVNAPVCYIALASASPATGTMAINTDGMVALFAATSANQLTLNVGVVRTRGGNTNTIFSAPIVIHRSVIDPDTAVPTPSILGTGVAAALQVAINTALGFVRLDASARLPAVDGSQLTNVPNELPSQTGSSGKYLTTNGTATSWGTVSTGLTVGTTAIASGTSGRILYDNAGVLGELPVGTGVATALAVNVGSAGAFITFNGDAGTPSALIGTNITGTAASLTAGLVSSIGSLTGDVTSSNRATTLATVNANVGSFTNASLTVNAKGLVTAASSGTSAVTSITGTANEITVTGTTTPTLSLPTALTFTAKTVTGGTFNSGAFNGTVGATTPSTVAGTTGTFSGAVTGATFNQVTIGHGLSGEARSDAIGAYALSSTTTGVQNTAIGWDTMAALTSGSLNVAVGRSALSNNLAGDGNTAIGWGALSSATGGGNVALGAYAGFYETASNAFYVDNQNRTNTAGDKAKALLYGTFAATAAAQQLTINAGTITLNGSAVTATSYAGAGTGLTGTAASLTAGTVTTNANLTGHVTSVGNAAVLGSFTMAQLSTAVSDGDPAYVGAANTFTTGQTISSTTSLLLGTAGSAVGNIGFRNATSGTTTLAPATGALGTGTVTLPLTGTLAISSGAQTFTGVQSMTSPDITTSITTPSTTFALVNATATTVNFAGGASTALNMGNAGGTNTVLGFNVLSTAGAASKPVLNVSGVPFAGTGTTSFPLVYINDANATASTTLSTAGTYFGVNGDGTQDLMNLLKDGVTQCKVSSAGVLSVTGAILGIGITCYNGGVDMAGSNTVRLRPGGAIGNGVFYITSQYGDTTCGIIAYDTPLTRYAAGVLQIGAVASTADATGHLRCTNITALGTLAVTGASTLTGLLTANGGITLGDAQNIAFNATTGTKIGAATTQKLSFWNATPIVQPTTAVASATVASPGGGSVIKTDDTFDGYTIAQVVKALRNAGLLA